ncbi:Rho termination factor [Flavobacterium sp. MDT1-60]|uniref:Rho termination factor n=1 Tax=Flavobacterium sp. MDT1-60 TaxID=1979344 RepID=UPI00177BA243|nr:Rho termination factor [Flavobacterium sp. MDT1-60]QOG01404.1 Rho termination factor [Flavobacterium sp. MDT1-60]
MYATTKNDYHGLLKEGYNKNESAQVTTKKDPDLKGEKTKPYEEWTKEELYQEAIKAGIPGRSYMSKKNLIHSLKKN